MTSHARFRPLSPTEQTICTRHLGLTKDEIQNVLATKPKAIIVGESPGWSMFNDCAMLPYPEGSAGHRLWLMSPYNKVSDYLRTFDRVDVLSGRAWNYAEARDVASNLLFQLPADVRLVLCGTKVAGAFQTKAQLFEHHTITSAKWRLSEGFRKLEAVVIPHPSGRNRMLADGNVRIQVALALGWAARLDEEL